MSEIKNTEKLGIGSLSLILSIFGMMFSFTYLGKNSIGEEILNAMSISFPTIIVSLILLSLSIIIGYSNKKDRYAKSGITLSIGFILVIFITGIFSYIIS